jgi:hypothetical protein
MAILGYIVQYSNEDDYTVYHGFKKLFKVYSEALENANEFYRSYLETMNVEHDGPFLAHKPTKKDADNQGSVVVFESRHLIVWVDTVIE